MISEVLSPVTPVPAPEWTPQNKEAGRVDALCPRGDRVVVGGNFNRPKPFLFTSTPTGSVGSLNPTGVLGRVYDIAWDAAGKNLYAAGSGGVAQHLASGAWFELKLGRYRSVGFMPSFPENVVVGADTGLVELLNGWRVSTPGSARDLVVTDEYVYVANYSGVISKIVLETGVVSVLASPNIPVLDLALSPDGQTLYAALGGPGGTVSGYNVQTGRRVWFHMTDGNCQAVCTMTDGTVIVGMHGDFVASFPNQTIKESGTGGRVPRKKVFALDSKGNLLKWKVDLTSTASPLGVWSLASSADRLYVGGDFTHVNGVEHPRTAAFDYVPTVT